MLNYLELCSGERVADDLENGTGRREKWSEAEGGAHGGSNRDRDSRGTGRSCRLVRSSRGEREKRKDNGGVRSRIYGAK